MAKISFERLDELEAKRDRLSPEQVGALDRLQAQRSAVPVDWIGKVGAIRSAGQYDPEQHRAGMLGDWLEHGMGMDLSTRTLEDGLGEVFGAGTTPEQAEQKLFGIMDEVQRKADWYSLTPEEQQAKAQSEAERWNPYPSKVDHFAQTNQPRVDMPGVEMAPETVGADEVAKQLQTLNQKAFIDSPAKVHEWAVAQLNPKEEKLAWMVAVADEPEKVGTFLKDDILALTPEKQGALWALAGSMNPQIDHQFMSRLGLAVVNPVKNLGRGLVDWGKGQGLDLLTLNDNARKFYDRLNAEFSTEELKTLWDENGAVNPAQAKRLKKLTARSAVPYHAVMGQPVISREQSQESAQAYFDQSQALYAAGQAIREKEKVQQMVRKAMQPHYTDLGGVAETSLGVVEGATYMTGLFAISTVPVVGEALAAFAMYAPQQAEWERRLIYEHNVEPGAASVLSSGFAAAYASVERLKIKGLDPKGWKKFIGERSRALTGHYLGEWLKGGARQGVTETAEEWLQTGVELSMLAAAEGFAHAEGIDWNQETEQAAKEMIQTALTMPMITLVGGANIRAARAIKKGVQKGSFKAAVGGLVPGELKQARADAKLDPQIWKEEQVVRRKMEAMEGKLIPQADVEFYLQHLESGPFGDLQTGETYAHVDDWLAAKGYNPETAREQFETSAEVYEAVRGKRVAQLGVLQAQLKAVETDPDAVPLPLDSDPFWGAVDYAQEGMGALLGVELEKFDTQAEAMAAHPELDVKQAVNGVAFVGQGKAVLIKEHLSSPGEAYLKWRHEVLGHIGLHQGGKRGELLKSLRETLGDELIFSMLPEYEGVYNSAELHAEELLVQMVEKLNPAKMAQQLEGGTVKQKLGRWLDAALGTKGAETMAAEQVMELAREVVAGSDPELDRELYPEGTVAKVGGADYTRSGGVWLTPRGKPVRGKKLLSAIERAADASIQKKERQATAARKRVVAEQIANEDAADAVISTVLENGGLNVAPDDAAAPDEFTALPKRFRATAGAGLAPDVMVQRVEQAFAGGEWQQQAADLDGLDVSGLVEYLANYEAQADALRDGSRKTEDEHAELNAQEVDFSDVQEGEWDDSMEDWDDIPMYSVAADGAQPMEVGKRIAYIKANKAGMRHANNDGLWWQYYSPALQSAYDMGKEGTSLEDQPHFEGYRFGAPPENGLSLNYSSDAAERGVSLAVRPDGTEVGSAMWFADRDKVVVRGLLLPELGSDGEALVLPYYVDLSEDIEEVIPPNHKSGEVVYTAIETKKEPSEEGSKNNLDTENNVYNSVSIHSALPVRRDESSKDYEEVNPRFSLASRQDPENFVPRVLAGHQLQGRPASVKMARSILKGLKAEIPAKKELEAMVAEAKEIVSTLYGKREQILNDRELSRLINSEADRRLIRRKMGDVEKLFVQGASEWKAAEREVIERQRARVEALKLARKGLSVADMQAALGFDLAELLKRVDAEELLVDKEARRKESPEVAGQDTPEESQRKPQEEEGEAVEPAAPAEIFREAPEEILYRLADAVTANLHRQGLIDTKETDIAMRKPWALEEYKRSLMNLFEEVAREFNFGMSREILLRQVQRLGSYRSFKGVNNRAAKMLESAYQQRIRQSREELVDRIPELTNEAKGRMKTRQADIRRAVKARTLVLFKHIREVYLMNPEEVEEQIEALQNNIATQNAPDTVDNVPEWLEQQRDRLQALIRFGALRHKPLADVAEAVDWLENHLTAELEAQEKRRKAAEEKAAGFRSLLVAVLPNRLQGARGDGWWKDYNSKNQFLEMRLEGLAREGSGAAQKKAAKALKQLAHRIGSANFRKHAAVSADSQAFMEALLAAYGGASSGRGEARDQVERHRAAKHLRNLTKTDPELARFSLDGRALSRSNLLQMVGMLAQGDYRKIALAQLALRERVLNAKGSAQEIAESLYQTPDDFIKFKTAEGLEMNGEQLLRLVVSIQGGALLARRLEMEPDMLAELSTGDVQLLDWFRGYYRENRAELSAMNKEITGLPFPVADSLYIPAKMDYPDRFVSGTSITMPLVPASLTPRTFNTRDLDETADVVAIWQQRLESNQQFMHFAPLYQETQFIFDDPKLIRKMINTHGENYVNQLKIHLRDVFSGTPLKPKEDVVGNALVNFMAATRLGFNVSLLPRQITSLPAFAMYVDTKTFMQSVGSAFTPEGRARMAEMAQHPYVKARLRGGHTQVMQDMLSGLGETGLSFWEGYKRLGALPTKYGDIIPTLVFGQGYYAAMLQEASRQGMKTQEGQEWAMDQVWNLVEQSQQSGLMVNLSEWQRHGNAMYRLLYQFHSTPMQFWAKQSFDWREWRAAAKNDGRSSDRFKEATKQFSKTTVLNFLVLGTMYRLAMVGWNTMLGDPPDEEDWLQFARGALTSPLGGILLVGTAIESAIDGGVYGEKSFGKSITPASAVFEDVQNVSIFLHHLTTGEPGELISDADKVLRSLNPLYRDVSKAVENYSE